MATGSLTLTALTGPFCPAPNKCVFFAECILPPAAALKRPFASVDSEGGVKCTQTPPPPAGAAWAPSHWMHCPGSKGSPPPRPYLAAPSCGWPGAVFQRRGTCPPRTLGRSLTRGSTALHEALPCPLLQGFSAVLLWRRENGSFLLTAASAGCGAPVLSLGHTPHGTGLSGQTCVGSPDPTPSYKNTALRRCPLCFTPTTRGHK